MKTLYSNGHNDTTYYLRYNPSQGPWQVRVSLSIDEWHIFNGWNTNPNLDSVVTVVLNDTSDEVYLTPDVTWKQFPLVIQLGYPGSITVDALPEGVIKTFGPDAGRSVGFTYNALSVIKLKANPDPGFMFVTWGDSAGTTKDTLRITMRKALDLFPEFTPSSKVYKVPIQVTANDNMKVEGRSKLTGRTECFSGAAIEGSLTVKSKSGGPEECVVKSDRITLGATEIQDGYFHTTNVRSATMMADSLSIHQGLQLKALMAHRLQVTQNVFPDYVFDEKAYTLKTIPEMERYIKENGHLEEIPPADSVRKYGLDLGEMYTSLVKKTEELSLYIIQLHRQIRELEEKRSKAAR